MDALIHTAREHNNKVIKEFPNINTEVVKDVIIFESKEHTDS